MIYNIIGLALDLIGVLLLFRFGILPNNLWEHILMDSGMSEKDEKRHKIWSKFAVILIFIGFALQLTGSIVQHQSKKEFRVLEKEHPLAKLNLEEEQNISTGIRGNLKLKMQDGKMYYQIHLSGLSDSFKGIGKFGINLEDSAGFKLSEIVEEYNSKNPSLSRLIREDSLFLTMKNSLPYSTKIYLQIKKWNLTVSKKNGG
jgi:hypothetical protein